MVSNEFVFKKLNLKQKAKNSNKTIDIDWEDEFEFNMIDNNGEKIQKQSEKTHMSEPDFLKNQINESLSTIEDNLSIFKSQIDTGLQKSKTIEPAPLIKPTDNINNLILQCVNYLKKDVSADEWKEINKIIAHAKNNKFFTHQFNFDAVKLRNATQEYANEIIKWNNILNEVKDKSSLDVNLENIHYPLHINFKSINEENDKLKVDLNIKSVNIELLEEKLIAKFDYFKEKINKLLKNIFDNTEEKIDPVLILKAITKI